MADLNEALILGHLGRDPEQRNFQNGGSVVNFSVATNRGWKDKTSGEWKSVTQWHNVVIFDEHTQKIAMQFLKKGSRVLVRGSIEARTYKDRDGNDRTTTEIVIRPYGSGMLMLQNKSDGGAAKPTAPEAPAKAAKATVDLDDDIPF